MPPSENESGVRLRTAMMSVRRAGLSASSGGRVEDKGVTVESDFEAAGRASRCLENDMDERGLGRDSCGIRLFAWSVERKRRLRGVLLAEWS